MPTFTIGDFQGSAQIDVPGNTLVGTQGIKGLTTAAVAVVAALPKPVTQAPFTDASFAATFEKPSIPLEGNTVDIRASVNSIISVAKADDSPLFGSDDYDPVKIAGNECWVGFELDTLLDARVAVPLPHGFGLSFDANTASAFATYLRISDAQAPTTTLQTAIGDTLGKFRIIATSGQVLGLPEDVIFTSDTTGTVKVAGSWSLPLAVNQLSLADASLPFNQSIAVNPAIAVKVGGSIAITSEFAVRFRRAGANLLRIGLYKKKGSTLTASFSASAGLGANLGNTDLIKAFFSATAPTFDLSGLPDGDAAKFRKVLTDSLNRSLSISLNAACAATHSDEAAMVYEVDTTPGDQATNDAVSSALRGDWTALAELNNAKPIRNVIRETAEKKFTLNVNLLGLYNFRTVTDFVRTMTILKNDEDGSVVITDSSSARRISTGAAPLAADPDKLRSALYEAFMATVTYQALGVGMGVGATFGAAQTLVNYHAVMDYREALKQLNAGEILGVVPASVVAGLPNVGGRVHHARFAASCTYSNDDVLRFFFSDIGNFTPRSAADLKQHGRSVLAGLLDPLDSVDQQRIAVLASDQKWAVMDANPATIKAPFFSDWFDITEWAEAVAKVGPVLADAIAQGKQVVGDPSADAQFMKKRQKLALMIDSVTHKTKAAFDHTFPICVMATLAGRAPGNPPPVFEAAWDGNTLFSNKPGVMAIATGR